MKTTVQYCLSFLLLCIGFSAFAQLTELKRNTRLADPYAGLPHAYMNGYYYFSAIDTASKGAELFRTDGTPAGTSRIKDINQTPASSGPMFPSTGNNVLNNMVFFTADDGSHGRELWRTDGTPQGTIMVKDIHAGTGDADIVEMRSFNGVMYFGANDGTNGHELWRTDGTETGTYMVINLASDQFSRGVGNFMEFNNELYFNVWDSVITMPSWYKTNGTANGTMLIRRLFISADMAVNNGYIYSAGDDPSALPIRGQELWKSDGTAAGSSFVKEINPGDYGSFPQHFHAINGTVIFEASSPGDGHELWKTDGTPAGTGLLKDLYPGSISGVRSTTTGPILYKNRLYFSGMDNTTGVEIWSTDGTEAGTTLLKNIGSSSSSFSPLVLGVVKNELFIEASASGSNVELWKSDGTMSGTTLVKVIHATDKSKIFKGSMTTDSLLFFTADNGTSGFELWRSDGTAAGTVMVKDIATGGKASTPLLGGMINNQVVFAATDSAGNTEIWISDGTGAGTFMLKDINTGTNSGDPQDLIPVNNILYFTASDGVRTGRTLWRTDGTESGTYRVKDINPTGNCYVGSLTELNGNLLFRASNGITGVELWRSDGSDTGTYQVKDLYPGSVNNSSFPAAFARLGNSLCFDARDEVGKNALWKTDGTAGGTVKLKNLKQNSQPGESRVVLGNELFFAASDASNETELWKTDGTANGTILVRNMSGTASSFPAEMIVIGNALYFNARNDTSVSYYDLWKSDGTVAGTSLLKANAVHAEERLGMVAVNNRLMYNSNDGSFATLDELWSCDTSGVLTRLKGMDISGVTDPKQNYVPYNDHIYFAANDGTSGYELWKSDATVPGTVQVADLAPGSNSSNARLYFIPGAPFALVHANDILYTFKDSVISPVGLPEVPVRKEVFRLYPNPAADLVHVTGQSPVAVKVEVIDLLGRKVYQQAFAQHEEAAFMASSFTNGVYYVKIITADHEETHALVVSR